MIGGMKAILWPMTFKKKMPFATVILYIWFGFYEEGKKLSFKTWLLLIRK